MKIERENVIFEGLIRFKILPFKGWDKFPAGNTTPSIENLETWQAVNTGAVLITNFKNGSDGQRLHILGDSFTSVANNATIKTRTGVSLLLLTNLIYNFTYINGVWYQDA